MLIEQVKKLKPLDRFIYWIRERNQIYLRRRAGKPKPWTDDLILQSFKFCNVRRCLDTVSQWLIENWYKPYRDHPNLVLACTLARQLNTTAALEAIGFPVSWNPEKVQAVLEQRARDGERNYSAAYMITSRYGKRRRAPQTKEYQTVWTVCNPVAQHPPQLDSSSFRETWKRLLWIPGFGSFIAGQVAADLRWALSGSWEDAQTWAPLGHGSVRGLNRYYNRHLTLNMDKASLERGDYLEEMRSLFNAVCVLPRIPSMDLMDFQNCLCEWDKYERTLWGQGRPKSRYDGHAK